MEHPEASSLFSNAMMKIIHRLIPLFLMAGTLPNSLFAQERGDSQIAYNWFER